MRFLMARPLRFGLAKGQAFKAVDAGAFDYLTVAEAKRLLNVCNSRFSGHWYQAALETGARYGEWLGSRLPISTPTLAPSHSDNPNLASRVTSLD